MPKGPGEPQEALVVARPSLHGGAFQQVSDSFCAETRDLVKDVHGRHKGASRLVTRQTTYLSSFLEEKPDLTGLTGIISHEEKCLNHIVGSEVVSIENLTKLNVNQTLLQPAYSDMFQTYQIIN